MKDILRAEILKAMGNPVRVRIIEILAQKKEMCVCELVPALGLDQPNVSQHLSVLRNARLVEARREGSMVFYRLKNEKAAKILELVDEIILDDVKSAQRIVGKKAK
jgi:ArsR family transcriptional regulator